MESRCSRGLTPPAQVREGRMCTDDTNPNMRESGNLLFAFAHGVARADCRTDSGFLQQHKYASSDVSSR